ncbi:MAG: SDR family NAD(P)-dependent oxidoreductase [Pseudomonadota bacterium]
MRERQIDPLNQLDLHGHTAVVTGAASGIGYATAERLLASGARVVLWDANRVGVEAAAKALGDNVVHTAAVDITNRDATAEAARSSHETAGTIDILVNSAGIAGGDGPAWEFDPDAWDRMIAVNLTGQFLVCRALLPQMIAGGWGRIVNVASVAGKEGNPLAAAYSASKAGLIGFTKSLAKELIDTGVLANVVTPGITETPLLDGVPQSRIDYMISRIPMGRMGKADEIAAMIAWLCSEDCSFSTGAVFDASGGRATY